VFGKGDIITLTQQIEGGWWEGTIGGKTGWFPSNYVKPCRWAMIRQTLNG
jgi:Rho guanine nucleotide exchange factor 7